MVEKFEMKKNGLEKKKRKKRKHEKASVGRKTPKGNGIKSGSPVAPRRHLCRKL
jgi:hypothetical protein